VAEFRIGLVAWGPLGQGFLTGKITRDMKFDDPNDLRKDFPRFTPKVARSREHYRACYAILLYP
jgi:aryl-alcohol dehydrogenase-like predicted oxidoreductase